MPMVRKGHICGAKGQCIWSRGITPMVRQVNAYGQQVNAYGFIRFRLCFIAALYA